MNVNFGEPVWLWLWLRGAGHLFLATPYMHALILQVGHHVLS